MSFSPLVPPFCAHPRRRERVRQTDAVHLRLHAVSCHHHRDGASDPLPTAVFLQHVHDAGGDHGGQHGETAPELDALTGHSSFGQNDELYNDIQ